MEALLLEYVWGDWAGACSDVMWEAKGLSQKYGERSRWVILDDIAKLPYCVTNALLGSVHPEVLDALLCGDLMYRYYHEPKFEAVVHAHHELTVTPGIYVNYICQKKHKGGGFHADAGKGLSIKQLRTVIYKMRLYFAHNLPNSDSYVRQCDLVWPSPNKAERTPDWADGVRHYPLTEDVRNKWIQVTKTRMSNVGQMSPIELEAPLRRSWAEVGFGQNCVTRASDHATKKATNKLFGLIHAIAEVEWPGQFEVKVFRIFRITDKDHSKLSGLVGSLICESFWFHGGLNTMLSENVDLSKDHLQELMARNVTTLKQVTFLDDNFEVSSGRLQRARKLHMYGNASEKERLEANKQSIDELNKRLSALEHDAVMLDQLQALVELKEFEVAYFRARAEHGLPPIPPYIV